MIVSAVAFVLTWFVHERPLRQSVAESGAGVGETFMMPTDDRSWTQLSRIVWNVLHRPAKVALIETVAARAGLDLSAAACWMLARIAQGADASPERVAREYALDAGRLRAGVDDLRRRGLVAGTDEAATVTPDGAATLERLRTAGREWICERLQAWRPEDNEELRGYLDGLATELVEGRLARGERPRAEAARA
jgi:DNA-binding MarR family transcriptional regulator